MMTLIPVFVDFICTAGGLVALIPITWMVGHAFFRLASDWTARK